MSDSESFVSSIGPFNKQKSNSNLSKTFKDARRSMVMSIDSADCLVKAVLEEPDTK